MSKLVHYSQNKLLSEGGTPIRSDAFANTDLLGTQLAADATLGTTFVGTGGGLVLSILPLLKAAYTATSPKIATILYITTDTGGIFLGSTTIVAGS